MSLIFDVLRANRRIARKELPALQRLLLIVLADHAGPDGICPSVETLSRETGASRSSVKRALSELVASGRLKKVARRKPDGSRTSSKYTIVVARSRPTSYAEYLRSDAWKRRRDAALVRAGFRCQVCNRKGQIDVHHRTYERIGDELPIDLVALCRRCHDLFHEGGRMPDRSAEDA